MNLKPTVTTPAPRAVPVAAFVLDKPSWHADYWLKGNVITINGPGTYVVEYKAFEPGTVRVRRT